MAADETPQRMAAMSCCPGGAVAMLGVGLGRLMTGSFRRLSARRERRRELEMLAAMWDAEFVRPPRRRV